jgi:predicted Zn-ribbon and HTH transcriptional regulator
MDATVPAEPVKCGHCGHEWKTTAVKPKGCPACHKDFTLKHKVIWLSLRKGKE